ncbi:Fis family transcriptional regulator [Paucibacter sp. KBW04]|uniref:GAF domain-containing protein n=1 Tax=Paucibacter sp. KBW04 TaxID=2153361 RepID=UPI000F5824A4|nr:GAF domain-containing protein [Paucibacter sp. KBW04]RQO63544.1 Fis family transcriptional regulator [Paucibacter sp. KBW04]
MPEPGGKPGDGLPPQPFFASPAQRMARAREVFFEQGQSPGGLVQQEVLQSWHRCLRAGLEPEQSLQPEPVSALRLDSALRRSRLLIKAAAPEMQQLEQALDGTACRILLVDAEGLVLRKGQGQRAEGAERAQASVLGAVARLGVNVSEAALGTNAPALVLRSGRACSVTAGEHFFSGIAPLHCTAAPIHDAQGRLAGALNLAVDTRSGGFRFEPAALVGMVAAAIENRLLCAQSQALIVLEFQLSREGLGSAFSALAGVSPEGQVLWLNAVAQSLSGGPAEGGVAVEGLLGLSAARLRAMLGAAPCQVLLPNGLRLWMRASLGPGTRLAAQEELAVAPAPVAHPAVCVEEAPARLLDRNRELILATVAQCGGNISLAAQRLGISRGRIYRQLTTQPPASRPG